VSDSQDLGVVAATPTVPDRLSSGPEHPRMSMRHRLARFGRPSHASVLDPLFKVLRSNHPKSDTAVVERAYRTAEHYHRGQLRKSGDPYITHPLAVATILAELGLTESTLCAALLHDTVEDTSYTIEQLSADFGDEVAQLVDGVTKLDKVTYGDVFLQNEQESSKYNFEVADADFYRYEFDAYERECMNALERDLPLPAYHCALKCSHAFNMLDARGALSATDRTAYILRVRTLAKACCASYLEVVTADTNADEEVSR